MFCNTLCVNVAWISPDCLTWAIFVSEEVVARSDWLAAMIRMKSR